MNRKGEVPFGLLVLCVLFTFLIMHSLAFNWYIPFTFEESNSQGFYISRKGLSKYSVKLIETRKSTDDNWKKVSNEKK